MSFDILDRILAKMPKSKPKEPPKPNQPACAFCGSTEGVKYKGGQLICKKCLRKARKMAKKYTR